MATTVKKKGGNTFYSVGSAPAGSSNSSTIFVKNIAERNGLDNPSGMVFVKDATGDRTVDRGWAIYILDDEGNWVKIIEEESVNGMWYVRNEIKKTLVSKEEFRKFKNNFSGSEISLPEAIEKIDAEGVWTELTIINKLNQLLDFINTSFVKTPTT